MMSGGQAYARSGMAGMGGGAVAGGMSGAPTMGGPAGGMGTPTGPMAGSAGNDHFTRQ